MLTITLAVYGIIALVRLVVQLSLAHWHHRQHCLRKKRPRGNSPESPEFVWPTITIIYPVYNESPEVLRLVMERAQACLTVPEISFIFVDDGSPNRSQLTPIYAEFASERMQIVYQANAGKRHAQCKGLQTATGEIIVTVDSDTLIELQGLKWLVAPLMSNPKIGAVCGEVLVENKYRSLMSALQSPRYWAAFEMERAAQSVFHSVLCCSGPFSAYRKSILDRIQKAYSSQMFFGRECTYGDDRHLTNLVLGCNYQVVYQPEAVAWTFVPETLAEYTRQQNRWNKSFYREILWTLKIADRVHLYSLIDMLLNPLLFILFTFTLAHYALLQLTTLDFRIAAGFLGMVLLGGGLRAIYGLYRTRSPLFLLFALYGLLHVFVLTPLRFKSLLTMTDTGWGTRSSKSRSFSQDFGIWATGYLSLILLIAGTIYATGGGDYQMNAALGLSVAPYALLWRSGLDPIQLMAALLLLVFALTGVIVIARHNSRRAARPMTGLSGEAGIGDFVVLRPQVLADQAIMPEVAGSNSISS